MKASEKLRSALIGILELGRKDTSNEKYDGYYESAEAAIRFADTEGDRQTVNRQQGETMIPTIGRIVHYRLSADDASQINRRRTSGVSITTRMKTFAKSAEATADPAVVYGWPEGAQAHIGNAVGEGDTFPMLITKVWGDNPSSAVNGQAYLDGNDVLWVTSACVGEGPRTFSWPTRA